jgi:hypothetical protein
MASEPDNVEIYVNKETKEILHYIPAAGMLDNGEDLPFGDHIVFITNINLDELDEEDIS